MRRIAVYIRVSTDKQDTAMQEFAVTEWLAKHDPGASVQFFREASMSGKLDKRPQFLALCEAVTAGSVDTVLVYRLDRLSRKASTAMQVMLDWMRAGIDFIAVDQPIFTLTRDSPLKLTMIALFSELAQIERETIVSRVRAGLRAAKARGVKLGAPNKLDLEQEREVVRLRRAGAAVTTVAAQMGVSAGTVKNICRKDRARA